MTRNIQTVITAALDNLDVRSDYARNVLRGSQCWSGADLRGKAAKYSSSYARMRAVAAGALFRACGRIISVEHNRRVSAVQVCVDDFGRIVFDTLDGYVAPVTRHQCRSIAQ